MTFERIRQTIQAHDVQLESCDRDGQEFCDCLTRAIDQTEATFAAALRELRAKLDSMMFNERHATPFTAIQKAQVELNATIAALGLADEAQEGER